MKTNKLGFTDLQITRFGLGTWAIGGPGYAWGWGAQDDDESLKTIHAALDQGINWIDTAPVYGLGHGEEIIGKAIKGMSERPYIFTKCGRRWDEKSEVYGDLTAKSVRQEVEDSLKRLGVDVIDLYQIHWPDPRAEIEEAWETIAGLITEGKIRYGGVSNFNVMFMEKLRKIHPIASLQPPYSMLDRRVETALLNYCGQQNIGVICYSPMHKGLLTGKFSRARVEGLPEDDHRRQDSRFKEPSLSRNLKLAEGLVEIAGKAGYTAAALAVAWTLRRSEVTAAIVGGRHPGQIIEIAAAGDWELTDEIIAEVDALLIQ